MSSSSSSYDSSSSSLSRSTSSSTSSIDSNSSESSSSLAISSSSSLSFSSSSSTTSESNSSSSSIDSSSTSSESFGNVSTSSSSSEQYWNRIQPLILGDAVASTGRLAQTLRIATTTYEVGKVYLYLYGPYGTVDFNLNLSLYEADANGLPSLLIDTQVIDGNNMIGDGWYAYEFGHSAPTPASGYISFVFWQSSASQDNYVLWGHISKGESSESSEPGYPAWISSDAITWTYNDNILRAIKVVGVFAPFDLTENQIVTPPASVKSVNPPIDGSNAQYNQTQALGNSIILDHPDTIMSFVVDSSGSMGWNDKFSNRQEAISSIINKFDAEYPSEIIYDFVKFGSVIADAETLSNQIGTYLTINLDARVPTRTTYIFSTAYATAWKGDIYENNGNYYEVQFNVDVGDTLVTYGNGEPHTEGDLTVISGVGSDPITYTSVRSITVDNAKFIAYGLRNLKNSRTYNFSGFSVDDSLVDAIDLTNWKLFYRTENPTINLGTNGPGDINSIDIAGTSTNTSTRKPFVNAEITSSALTNPVEVGDSSVYVSDASKFFVEDLIDIVDGNAASIGHVITAIDGNKISISPDSRFEILEDGRYQGQVQITGLNNLFTFDGTTVMLYCKDTDVLDNDVITFYLQSTDGYYVEWDFKPHKDWYKYNIFWLDRTAEIPISLFDVAGNPFPDGTKIELEVNERNVDALNQEVTSKSATQVSAVGSTKIYLEDVDNLSRDLNIDLVDNQNNIQNATIAEIGEDATGIYIEILQPLQFEFDPANGARVLTTKTADSVPTAESQISMLTPIVDVTPLVANTPVPPSAILPHDPDQVPIGTPYSDLDINRKYMLRGNRDAISVNGEASIRILPITEDNLKTIGDKKVEAERLLRLEPPEQFNPQEKQNVGDSIETLPTVVPEESQTVEGDDWTIETPVYLYQGLASSSMTTSSTTFESTTFLGLSLAGINTSTLLVTDYDIYPSVALTKSTGETLARQYFNSFPVYFTPPVFISSDTEDTTVPYWCESESGGECSRFDGYVQTRIPGIYASSGDSFTINYTVTDRLVLMRNGSLTIKMYTNKVHSLDEVACNEGDKENFAINVKYPPKVKVVDGVSVTTQKLSNIDKWRNAVENNVVGEVLADINVLDATNYGFNSIGDGSQEYTDLVNIHNSEINTVLGSSTTSEEILDLFYTNPEEWTLATQYDVYETQIDIVNGKASITIPANDIVSLMFVEASYMLSDGRFEVVKGDLFVNANPVDVGAIDPGFIDPIDGESYELGVNVTWMNGENGVIEDNISVEFESTTGIEPSISVTDNGKANGVFIGPAKEIWYDPEDYKLSLCPPVSESEIVNLTITHPSGYTRRISRRLEWFIKWLDQSAEDEPFYFFCTSNDEKSWADGTVNPSTVITSDLNDGVNGLYDGLVWVGEDGVKRLQGLGQLNDEASTVKAQAAVKVTPSRSQWNDGTVSFTVGGINKNIGHSPPFCENIYFAPWENEIRLTTRYVTDDGAKSGIGLTKRPTIGPDGNLIFSYPIALFDEPLNVTVSMETEGNQYIRDGVYSPEIVATVTWRGEHLTDQFTINHGTENEIVVDYSLPTVTFEAGLRGNINSDEAATCPKQLDNRLAFGGFLNIENDLNVSLTSYAAQVSLSRTDIFTGAGTSHTHKCSVDTNGNGITTSTIVMTGSVASHTHTITNYITDNVLSHTHGIRSVAVVNLNPTTVQDLNVAINAYCEYDPTNCAPYDGDMYDHIPQEGNRLMYASTEILGIVPSKPKLILEIISGPDLTSGEPILPTQEDGMISYYTAETPVDTERGFDIKATAYFSSYVYEDFPGHFITIPSRPVDDGTRINFEIVSYRPDPKTQIDGELTSTTTLVVAPDATRDYMILQVLGTISSEGLYAETKFPIMIRSNLQWLPNIKGLVTYPTNDSIYVSNALSQIDTIGASQINDAVELAAQRIITFQTNEELYKEYKKYIVLLTDGDENTSQFSIDQAINNVSFVHGAGEVPIIPIKLGYSHATDDLLLKKYAADTESSMAYSIDLTSDKIDELVEYIVTSGIYPDLNQGIYSDRITIPELGLPIRVALEDVTLPGTSSVVFRVRTSQDLLTWTPWSAWLDSSEFKTFTNDVNTNALYFDYEVKLFGSDDFTSPVVNGGATAYYYKKGELVVFLNPIAIGSVGQTGTISDAGASIDGNIDGGISDDEYLASIHITHEVDIPSTSTVTYGIQQEGSTEIDDYSLQGLDLEPDKHTIMLTRYNEPLTTVDYTKFTALNGRFSEVSDIEVYRINKHNPNGKLVPSTEYSVNATEGIVTFTRAQPTSDALTINIGMVPTYKIICKAVNYGEETATIHYIGIMYNVMKRIPRDFEGNTIHTPISTRI